MTTKEEYRDDHVGLVRVSPSSSALVCWLPRKRKGHKLAWAVTDCSAVREVQLVRGRVEEESEKAREKTCVAGL